MFKKLKFFIPNDFKARADNLMDDRLNWNVTYSIKDASAVLSCYVNQDTSRDAIGNLICVPGVASNTFAEPMMRAIIYWGLSNEFNVFCINTFLGDFRSNVTDAQLQSHSYRMFVDLVGQGIKMVENYRLGPNYIVAHSMGATAVFDSINRRIMNNKPTAIKGAVMFAPYVGSCNLVRMSTLLHRRFWPGVSYEEFMQRPIQLNNPSIDVKKFITIYPQFFADAGNATDNIFQPHIMSQYDMPVTIIGGGQDLKVPAVQLRKLSHELTAMPNGNLFKYIEFPNAKHSFNHQHDNAGMITKIIKAQHPNMKLR